MNAYDAIEERVKDRLWRKMRHDSSGRGMVCTYTDTSYRKLTVRYRLYGGMGSRRLCRWYGIDDDRYVNWGVERAYVEQLTTGEIPQRWVPELDFTGKNKKRQVLAWLKEH